MTKAQGSEHFSLIFNILNPKTSKTDLWYVQIIRSSIKCESKCIIYYYIVCNHPTII